MTLQYEKSTKWQTTANATIKIKGKKYTFFCTDQIINFLIGIVGDKNYSEKDYKKIAQNLQAVSKCYAPQKITSNIDY